eukprot:6001545-Amphidinium_carterae.1
MSKKCAINTICTVVGAQHSMLVSLVIVPCVVLGLLWPRVYTPPGAVLRGGSFARVPAPPKLDGA